MYEFEDKYRIGIEYIDMEHKKFFDYINEGVKALDLPEEEGIKAARELLTKLTEYAYMHFADEEAYMRKTKDAMLLTQLPLHQDFRNKIKEFLSKSQMGRKDIGDIFVFMASWLRSHILAMDMEIGKNQGESMIVMTDNFLTGIEIVDEEHRQLFDIIGRAYAIAEDELVYDKYDSIISVLTELKDYTVMHFQDEEQYMESIGYEGLEAQKKVHAAFIDKLVNMDLDDLESMDDDQTGFLNELLDFLTEWLVEHILKMDKRIPAVQA